MNSKSSYLIGGLLILGAIGFSEYTKTLEKPQVIKPKATPFIDTSKPYISPYKTSNPSNHKQYTGNIKKTSYKYHYEVTISNSRREWETYEQETLINGQIRLKKVSPDICYDGTYIWDSNVYLPNEDAMFNYIISNYPQMRQYRINTTICDPDEYNYNLDAYLEDPEDEATFDPQIYDFYQD